MNSDFVRSTTAAKALGVSRQGVSMLKRSGRLSGPHGYVSVQSLEALIAKRSSPQRVPTSGGYFKPKGYKAGERDLMKSNKNSSGAALRKNHHYIVMKP